MSEIAFQVHYQYLLSQLWMNEAYISWIAKGGTLVKQGLYPQSIELQTQMRNLEKLYPDYYANWKKEHELRELKSRTNVITK